MNESHQSNSTESLTDLQGTWLISFADLITLLLCSFLMFFTLTWNAKKNVPNMSKDTAAHTQTQSHGIHIAESKIDDGNSEATKPLEQRLEVRFLKEDFENYPGGLKASALQKVKDVMNIEAYKSATVSMALCTWQQTDGNSPSESSALLRVASQLIDAGVMDKQLAFEFLGSNCLGIRDPEDTGDQTIGRIAIERVN